MSKKKIASKLFDSLRQARETNHAPVSARLEPELARPVAQGQPSHRPEPIEPPKSPARLSTPVATNTAQSPIRRVGTQDEQSPAASTDRPWANLHPRRIWPD